MKVAQYDTAMVELQKVIDLYPSLKGKSKAQYEIASIWFIKGDKRRAAAEFQKIIDLYPNEQVASYAAFRVGYCLMGLKEYESAVKQFEKAEELYKDFPQKDWLLYFTGKCLHELGRTQEGNTYLQRLISEYKGSSLVTAAKRLLGM